jgi:hypothetical protein
MENTATSTSSRFPETQCDSIRKSIHLTIGFDEGGQFGVSKVLILAPKDVGEPLLSMAPKGGRDLHLALSVSSSPIIFLAQWRFLRRAAILSALLESDDHTHFDEG